MTKNNKIINIIIIYKGFGVYWFNVFYVCCFSNSSLRVIRINYLLFSCQVNHHSNFLSFLYSLKIIELQIQFGLLGYHNQIIL